MYMEKKKKKAYRNIFIVKTPGNREERRLVWFAGESDSC
jgi:hypothetical protein